jgi:hypothetical protein
MDVFRCRSSYQSYDGEESGTSLAGFQVDLTQARLSGPSYPSAQKLSCRTRGPLGRVINPTRAEPAFLCLGPIKKSIHRYQESPHTRRLPALTWPVCSVRPRLACSAVVR